MEPSNILIIDDERVICDGCRVALSDKGHSVDICMNGKDGLETILKGTYDLALLDMKLPDMDGMDILRTVEREKLGVYVIVMTGYSTVQNAVEAMKLGAFDYLAKPFSDDELVLAVERAMEKKRLVEENLALRQQLSERFDFSNIIGENPRILKIFNEIQKVAPTNSTVLLHGESGTGKELFARAIHAHSKRAARQFVAVDCSTFSSSLLESELFGHVKGAFTGAIKDKAGIFEAANHGSLFLDEVGNLDMDIQAKLLRAIETQEFKPVGASQLKKSDVRIIAATNRDLEEQVRKGQFREDLFYRLNVFPITVPPLRERIEDIPLLVEHFLEKYARDAGKRVTRVEAQAMDAMATHGWPGNVRELKHSTERAVIMSENDILCPDDFFISSNIDFTNTNNLDLGNTEKKIILKALKKHQNNISKTAIELGLSRSALYRRIEKYNISLT